MAMTYAALLGAATKTGPVAAAVVTVLVLLILGTVFWSFLRRSRSRGVDPLAVDLLEPQHLPEPADPTQLPGQATGGEGPAGAGPAAPLS